ncbi:MAG TPA: glycine cleavage system protein GcvH [Armatimonadota bacterium]|jgi:glycine cleavage system H protein
MSKDTARYTKAHAWMQQDGSEWLIGISDYAADKMGDIIYVELPAEGAALAAGEPYGSVESAKAVEDLIAPLAGTVARANTELEDAPETLNTDPFEGGWVAAVTAEGDVDLSDTMDATEYAAYVASLGE